MTAGKTVTLRCVNSDGEAHEICSSCDQPVCEQCIDRRKTEAIVCRNCSYKLALTGVDQTQAVKRAAAQRIAIDAKKPAGRVRRAVGWVALVGVLAVLFGWAGPIAIDAFASEDAYALGPVGEEAAPGLNDCVQGLWKMRAAIDTYRYKNGGKIPTRLAVLKQVDEACPGCDNPWRYLATGASYRVACSKPHTHERAAVFLDHRVGPPQVQLDKGVE